MAGSGIPEPAGFWVGGKTGRLLHGDVGAIVAQIERATFSARALLEEVGGLAPLLASDGAHPGDASDALRRLIASATTILTELDRAAQAAVAEIVESA
jgi:hypothetical protein